MWPLKGVWAVYALGVLCVCSGEVSDSRLQEAVNTFSVNLLKKVYAAEPGNVIISPLSVSMLLAILHQGARHDTASQLENALHLSQQESREGYSRLSRSMQEERNSTSILEVASRLFARRGLDLRQDFQDIVSQDFRSAVQQVDFGDSEASTTINSWVSEATHGRITNIVEPVLPANVELILANAVYFKSPWRHRFSKSNTSNDTFTRLDGSQVTVPFMRLDAWLQAGQDPEYGVKWVKLPFLEGDYGMVIVVPDQAAGLTRLLEDLSARNLSRYILHDTWRPTSVVLPRFRLDSNIDLVRPLMQLGLTDIFDATRADLSGVTSSGGLVVSRAYQKADIDVDEDGATASAATIIEMNRKSRPVINDPLVIRADHPFIAVIADSNYLPIFMAVVDNPSA